MMKVKKTFTTIINCQRLQFFSLSSAELLAIQNAIQDKETKALFERSVSTLTEKR